MRILQQKWKIYLIYAKPYDEKYPVVCLDEKPKQLLDERREAIPIKKGSPKKTDNEYNREGTCSIFVDRAVEGVDTRQCAGTENSGGFCS